MPRFFPSLTRSRERRRDDHKRYDEYGHYDEQQQPSSSAWRRVTPSANSRDPGERWSEEVVEYPSSYAGLGTHGRNQHPSVHDYERHSESSLSRSEESYDERYRHDNAIPIVQRESSLSRLQEAFADHGLSGRPVTQVSLPQQATPMHSPRDVHPTTSIPSIGSMPPSVPHPTPIAELRNVYPEQHQPVLMPTMSVNSQHADIIGSQSQRAREKRPQYRDERSRYVDERRYEDDRLRYRDDRTRYRDEGSRYRDEGSRYRDQRTQHRDEHIRPRRGSSSSSRLWDEDEEYPPCVVVVERGRHGKKDTYYIIPGGAPVIFEDDKGNELTRVGDFSGRYRPRRQRPVIIEDDKGREIGRLGFDDASSLDYEYQRSYGSEDGHPERDGEYTPRRKYSDSRGDHRSSSRSYPSVEISGRHSSRRSDRGEYRHDSPTRGRSPPSPSGPNVVFIPPSSSGSVTSSSPSDRPSRRNYEPSRSSHRSHDSNVIHLDDLTRQMSGSASSRSSGRRSHDSERHH